MTRTQVRMARLTASRLSRLVLIIGISGWVSACGDLSVGRVQPDKSAEALGARMSEFEPYATRCQYTAGELTYAGPCLVEVYDKGHIVSWVDRKLTWVDGETQNFWGNGKLNGKSAVRFEHNRSAHSYTAVDLSETLDVGLE